METQTEQERKNVPIEEKKKKIITIIKRIVKVTRKQAKYYTLFCDLCKDAYNTHEPLYLLETSDFNKEKYIATVDSHIFTEEQLNKRLQQIQEDNGIYPK